MIIDTNSIKSHVSIETLKTGDVFFSNGRYYLLLHPTQKSNGFVAGMISVVDLRE
jgi:hypothetical protein